MKDLIIGVIAVAALVVGGFAVTRDPGQIIVPTQEQSFAGSGSEFGSRVFFKEGATVGGTVMATSSTATTYTITAADLNKAPQVISWTPNVNTTLSISASSTRAYVPNVGDTAEVYFRNASSTAAASITFAAADAGVDMQFTEATGGDLVLIGLDWAKVTLIRTSTHLVTVIFDEMTEAD